MCEGVYNVYCNSEISTQKWRWTLKKKQKQWLFEKRDTGFFQKTQLEK